MKPHQREDKRYKSGMHCNLDAEEKVLCRFLEQHASPRSRILDVGCGPGEIALEIQRKGYRVKGVDFSPVAIDIASKAGLDCQIVDVDEGLPFGDREFEVVWASDVIEHVFDPISVLCEMHRVLVPDGLLLATIPYDLYLTTRLRILFGRSYQENVYRQYRQYKHHTFFSKRLLEYMLKEASFDIEEIHLKCRIPFFQKEFITRYTIFLFLSGTMVILARAKKS